jgi:hypothetical protein
MGRCHPLDIEILQDFTGDLSIVMEQPHDVDGKPSSPPNELYELLRRRGSTPPTQSK